MNNELITRTITGLCFATTILGTLIAFPPWCFAILLATIFIFIILVELPKLAPITSFFYWVLLFGYLLLPFSGIAFLNYYQTGKQYLIMLFLIGFSHDTAALITGKLFGKHKLAPTISQGKTWEGFIGGFLGVFVILLFFQHRGWIPYSSFYLFSFSGILAIVATTGDLFESWLKRRAQIKDSSSILPGHGGFLDRFDSVIFLFVFLLLITPVILFY